MNYSQKKLRIIIGLVVPLLYLSSLNAFATQAHFDLPSGWIEIETPEDLPPEIMYLKKYATEDQSTQVSLSGMRAIKTTSGANEYIEGMVSSMKERGLNVQSVSDSQQNGLPCKYIQGEFELEGDFLSETFVFFLEDQVIGVSVTWNGDKERADLVKKILDRVKIRGVVATLSDENDSLPKNFRSGEKVGRYTIYAIVGIVLIILLRKKVQPRE